MQRIERILQMKILRYYAITVWGGVILHELGERFNSPTVNLFFSAEDYLKFLKKLDYYLEQPLVEIESDKDYPVAKLDDITIYFMHYLSFDEAKTTWKKRVARINRNNLYVIFVQQNGCTEQILREFDDLPYKHKLVLTAKPMPEIQCSYCIPNTMQRKCTCKDSSHKAQPQNV